MTKRKFYKIAAYIMIILIIIIFITAVFNIPKPGLCISISIRLLSCFTAVYLIFRLKEWRLIFLAVMFFLMAARQILTLMIWLNMVEINYTTRMISEIPGFIVTILTFISIFYIGFTLSGKMHLIQKQNNEIKDLTNLLPICSNCKKIRDDHGYWKQLESYFDQHSEITFSHGICPDCEKKLYAHEEWYENKKK